LKSERAIYHRLFLIFTLISHVVLLAALRIMANKRHECVMQLNFHRTTSTWPKKMNLLNSTTINNRNFPLHDCLQKPA